MIVRPLEEAHPGSNWKDPQLKSSMFGNCAREYYDVAQKTDADFKSSPHFYTLIGNMHLSIELAIKGIAIRSIAHFNPKQYSHKPSQIIKDYSDQISVFKKIQEDKEAIQMIEELENGFVGMRYGEMYVSIDEKDRAIYKNLFIALIDFLNSITKVKFMPHHFNPAT
jgi:hypothetical protein